MYEQLTYQTYEELLLALQTEEQARRYLAYVRWGGEPKCPHCGYQDVSSYCKKRKVFYCSNKGCFKQFSVTTGTIFERTHVPLLKWFKAMFEISNGSIASTKLAKKLTVNQRTAWKMEQKIRQSLKSDMDNIVLSNIVEADTSLFSPKLDRDFQRRWSVSKLQKIAEKDNNHEKQKRKRLKERERTRRRKLGLEPRPTGRPKGRKDQGPRQRRGFKNKYYKYEKWVLGMVERGGKIYLELVGQHSSEISKNKVADIMMKHLSEDSMVLTDSGGEFEGLSKVLSQHEKVIHEPWIEFMKKDGTKGRRKVKRFVEDNGNHTNTIESIWAHLKRVQWGTHIQISYGHADKYLYEFAFQRNNRELSDAEKFQLILKSALRLGAFPYSDFKHYSRIYRINELGNKIGKRTMLNRAA